MLIFDEVITGFRLALGGAQALYGVTPDLSAFAKGLGGGFPVAAMGGRKDIMALVADGTVSMAGTYAANGIAVAAANAALDELAAPGLYERLFAALRPAARRGCSRSSARPASVTQVVGVGPVLQVWFADQSDPQLPRRRAPRRATISSACGGRACSSAACCSIPGAFENLFVSFAHTEADIDWTLDAARETVREVRRA